MLLLVVVVMVGGRVEGGVNEGAGGTESGGGRKIEWA